MVIILLGAVLPVVCSANYLCMQLECVWGDGQEGGAVTSGSVNENSGFYWSS